MAATLLIYGGRGEMQSQVIYANCRSWQQQVTLYLEVN